MKIIIFKQTNIVYEIVAEDNEMLTLVAPSDHYRIKYYLNLCDVSKYKTPYLITKPNKFFLTLYGYRN